MFAKMTGGSDVRADSFRYQGNALGQQMLGQFP
jgi:hypothetical protein